MSSSLIMVPIIHRRKLKNYANWVEVSNIGNVGIPPACNDIDSLACRIEVSVTQTTGTAPNRTLKSTTVIISFSLTGLEYWVQSAGNVIRKRNKSK
jgi:hypothetical protein